MNTNAPQHAEKRQQAITRILERNPDAFNKPVSGGTQRKCHCKRSRCLKKYCECFQAGLACLPECSCVSCQNFEGSDLRKRIMAGEDVQLRPVGRDRIDDDEDEDDELPRARPTRRAASRRKRVLDESSGDEAEPKLDDEKLSLKYAKNPLENIAPPNALPIKLPAGSNRSIRNQLVRLDMCSFVGSAVGPFSNMLLVGLEQSQNRQAAEVKQEVEPHSPKRHQGIDLRAQETLESSQAALQEKFVLEETASFLKKVLTASEGSLESQKILMF